MSLITLETLRADFEFKLAIDNAGYAGKPRSFGDIEWLAENYPNYSYNGMAIPSARALGMAAQLFLIAASYDDEREGIQAAMLYKLSDGAIDPRKAGAQ